MGGLKMTRRCDNKAIKDKYPLVLVERKRVNIDSLSAQKIVLQQTLLFQRHYSGTMKANLLIVALCFFSTVNLCGANTSESAPTATQTIPVVSSEGTTKPPTGAPNTAQTGGLTTVQTGGPTTVQTGGPTTAQTGGPDTAQTKEPDTTPSSGPTTEAPGASGGLSGGAIAGITVGTIAGVGLLGGGVFGLLKEKDYSQVENISDCSQSSQQWTPQQIPKSQGAPGRTTPGSDPGESHPANTVQKPQGAAATWPLAPPAVGYAGVDPTMDPDTQMATRSEPANTLAASLGHRERPTHCWAETPATSRECERRLGILASSHSPKTCLLG
ncbi:hypothetical protein AMECASPLE_029929 [Ameca splendens]|uniref:Uncharacterized protein n=1 Tax=Ameca splendens TaxID=208324 RepID=A0ABV0Z431_9TELE